MLQRTLGRKFLGNGFSGGFSKGFFGNSGTGGSGSGSNGGFSRFFGSGHSNSSASSSGGATHSPFGGLGPGGPLGGFIDKALEWCSESHARDIARDMGVDLRNIRFEKTSEGGVNVMVDAPNATPLQIEQLGKRVQEECPVARFRKTQVQSSKQEMKWVLLPPKYDR